MKTVNWGLVAHMKLSLVKSRCKHLVNPLLDKCPPLKTFLKRMFYAVMFILWKLEVKVRDFSKKLDVDKICWVRPERIQHCARGTFYIYNDKGKMIGGNWDRLEKKFEETDVYQAFKERFMDGKDWKDTAFYRRVLDQISSGEVKWGCRTESEFDKRCKRLESLYQKIKNDGYKSQKELSLKADTYPLNIEDEITVCVGRKGDLLLNEGRHRLAIAKLLDVRKVPVRITIRHLQWQKFRKRVLNYAEKHDGKIYHPITHPDLCDVANVYGSEDRFDIIKKKLSLQKGRLLDIGAHWGYFCHKFEELGFDCYAVENDPVNVYFLEKLRRAENRSFKIISESILECQGIRDINFNVVLALNIFHHFLKEKTNYLKFINLLQNLGMKELFFQPHVPDEPQMEDAYRNYTNREFAEFILRNSCLNEAKLVGVAEGGRSIWKLY